MRIQSPALSLRISRDLQRSTTAISRALERLSTGLRINSAADGAAELSTSERLKSQILGTSRAAKNLNEGLSLLQTADSSLSTQLEIVQRLRELALASANGTLSASDRAALETEFQSLLEQFNQITSTAQLGEIHLLNDQSLNMRLQSGANAGDSIDLSYDGSLQQDIFTQVLGNGTFSGSGTLASAGHQAQLVLEDLDGDGKADLFALNRVYRGNGDGTFTQIQTISTTGDAAAVGDINNDGIKDLVTSAGSVTVHLGLGDGTFGTGSTYLSMNSKGVTLGDFNDDGALDIAASDATLSSVSILLNNGSGQFSFAASYNALGANAQELIAEDFDGDGHIDILQGRSTAAGAILFRGNGDGGFDSGTIVGNSGYFIEAGDFNHDGAMDFVTRSFGTSLTVSLNNGVGSFSQQTLTVDDNGAGYGGIRVADLNGDGNLDILAGNSVAGTISVFTGDGQGSFATQVTTAVTTLITNVDAADLNGDGVMDVVAKVQSANFHLRMQNSSEQYNPEALTIATDWRAEQFLAVADQAMKELIERRSSIGAQIHRLEHGVSAALLLEESLAEARSRTIDVDIAEETAELVRQQILQQASIAASAQANLSLQTVLQLLEF